MHFLPKILVKNAPLYKYIGKKRYLCSHFKLK